jgi:phosphoserine phosphatase RsbU/P
MDKLKQLVPFFILFPFAVAAIVYFFPNAHPYGGVSLPLDQSAIEGRSLALLSELNISQKELSSDIKLIADRSLLRQTQKDLGIAGSNKAVRDSIPVYQWKIQWRKDAELNFNFSNRDENAQRQREKTESLLSADVSMRFDTKGQLLEFNRKFSDTLSIESYTPDNARRAALGFLHQYSPAGFMADTTKVLSEKTVQQLHRLDYEYNWQTQSHMFGNVCQVQVRIAGNIIASYNVEIVPPATVNSDHAESISSIATLILILIGSIFIVFVAVKRIRNFEIGFRQALVLGGAVTTAFGLQLFINIHNTRNLWEIIIPVLVVPVFVGGAFVLLWAVSETIVREVWKEKMLSLDLIVKGYIFHPNVGVSVSGGLMLGSILIALFLVLMSFGGVITPITLTLTDESSMHTFDSNAPWLYILSHAFIVSSYLFTFALLFIVSLLRKYISSNVLVVFIAGLAFMFMIAGAMTPFIMAVAIQGIMAFIIVWLFCQYDVLTMIISLMVYVMIPEVAGLFCTGSESHIQSGIIILGGSAVVFLGAFSLLFRKNVVIDFDEITPIFAKHISERQRMQQELEIARTVQMSFLPKCDPIIPQFDICSRCIPALEVGGDYYDFVELGDNKLAVAIGDVSGKGTQAAFFMTLTKGFLRALAHVSESPAKVLTQVNHLFYENVERGIFISMIYGVFDTMKKTLSLARAGHNPVIMRKSLAAYVQIVNPTGIALGLDPGSKFSQSIEEVTIDYKPGDLFIFYTDGLTEAMNAQRAQFGEERLSTVVEQLASSSASEIVEGIYAEIKSFVGRTKQHDDMTIVVIKVKSAASE